MPKDPLDDRDALIAELADILRTGRRPRPDPRGDRHELDEAIARHYARQQEGLPPPVPSTAYLWGPHRRYLNEVYPVPRPPGGWVEPVPTFDEWLERQGLSRAALAAQAAARLAAGPDPGRLRRSVDDAPPW